jgi:metal-responsive CopG/Arc/MetJ family transcriptional regulator
MVVEEFNNPRWAMATVNYSVPEAVKQAFDETFKGRNKSAVIAELMQQAVEEIRHQAERNRIAESILETARSGPYVSDEEIWALRQEGRD